MSRANLLYTATCTKKTRKSIYFLNSIFLQSKKNISDLRVKFDFFPFNSHSFYHENRRDFLKRKKSLRKKNRKINNFSLKKEVHDSSKKLNVGDVSFFDIESSTDSDSTSSYSHDETGGTEEASLLDKLDLNKPRFDSNVKTTINFVIEFNRFFEQFSELNYEQDSDFLSNFVYTKKKINKLVVPDRRNSRKIFIKSQAKFYYYYYRNDPLANSYLLNKIICVFSKGFNKILTRKAFYKLFFSSHSEFTVDFLYAMIDALKPKYINVKARRGREHYEAPIEASSVKSTMKAIKFFKKAVLSHGEEKTLYGKLKVELEKFFF